MSTSTVDVFGDNSGIELIRFDSDLTTANNGSLSVNEGSLTFKDGKYDKCVDAVEVKLEGMPDFTFTGDTHNPASFTFWIRCVVNSGNSEYDIFCYNDASFGGWEITYNYDEDRLYIYNGINDRYLSITDSDWHHIAVVWDLQSSEGGDSPRINIYLDGDLKSSDAGFDDSRGSAYVDDTHLFCIGYGTDTAEEFYIDQIRFFNRDLTSSEVTQLMNETAPPPPLFTQRSSIGEYPSSFFRQNSSVLELSAELFSQQSSVVDDGVIEIFTQQSSIEAFNDDWFSQRSTLTLPGDAHFKQSSKVHDYQPYEKKETVCDLFNGAPAPIFHSQFNGSLDAGCGAGTYDVELGHSVSYAPGVIGDGVRVNETIYMQWVPYSTDSIAMGLWMLSDAGEEVVHWNIAETYVRAGLTAQNRVFISMEDRYGNVYVGYEGLDDVSSTPTHILININAGEVRFLINNILVMTGTRTIDDSSTFNITYGRVKNEGIIDQVRIFDGGLTPYQERAVYYDAVAGTNFKQLTTIGAYQDSISQSSSVEAYHDGKFIQRSYLNTGKVHIFHQLSKCSYWVNKEIFRQMSTIEEIPKQVIIRRVN